MSKLSVHLIRVISGHKWEIREGKLTSEAERLGTLFVKAKLGSSTDGKTVTVKTGGKVRPDMQNFWNDKFSIIVAKDSNLRLFPFLLKIGTVYTACASHPETIHWSNEPPSPQTNQGPRECWSIHQPGPNGCSRYPRFETEVQRRMRSCPARGIGQGVIAGATQRSNAGDEGWLKSVLV